MKNTVFTGVCTALVTPFSHGKVDLFQLEYLLEKQMEAGVAAVCVCGTTGEASTLSSDEQSKILQCAVNRCGGKIKIIAGAGSNDTKRAICLSKQACCLGADAVLVVTPYYNKTTEDGLVIHYTAVADEISCPLILYNVPSRTAVDISPAVCKKLSVHEKIVGIKEASGSTAKTARILSVCPPDFTVWSGNDDDIVPQMSAGAKGVISVFSNLCPKEAVSMTDACLAGNYSLAAQLQQKYMEMIDILFCEVNPIPIKEAMNLAGYRVGPPRLPLCELSRSNKNRLKTVLTKYGII